MGGRGGKRGGVVEAVLKGEKLFLSINKEIRLKYSNHLNIFAGDVTYGVSKYQLFSQFLSVILGHVITTSVYYVCNRLWTLNNLTTYLRARREGGRTEDIGCITTQFT